MNTYNATNPFRIPSCLQRADIQQRRRDRIKKAVIGTVAGIAALMVVLLIEGCMSEHAKAAGASKVAAVEAPAAVPAKTATAESKPLTASQTNPVTMLAAAPAAPKAAVHNTETTYTVKSGDTLARIAKQHGLTIKALKSVNVLDGDNLVVGMKLKLPTA